MDEKISPVCIYIEDISENESVCRKGLPTDIRCWTGKDSPCWYYSNYYEPDVDEVPIEQAILEAKFKRIVTSHYYLLRTILRNFIHDAILKLKDITPPPFIRWHILLGRVAIVAARDSRLEDKQKAIYVCDGLLPDDFQINKAIEQLDYKYGDWEWKEIRRRNEWRWPWQLKTRITKLGEGGTIYLSGGVFNISESIKYSSKKDRG